MRLSTQRQAWRAGKKARVPTTAPARAPRATKGKTRSTFMKPWAMRPVMPATRASTASATPTEIAPAAALSSRSGAVSRAGHTCSASHVAGRRVATSGGTTSASRRPAARAATPDRPTMWASTARPAPVPVSKSGTVVATSANSTTPTRAKPRKVARMQVIGETVCCTVGVLTRDRAGRQASSGTEGTGARGCRAQASR